MSQIDYCFICDNEGFEEGVRQHVPKKPVGNRTSKHSRTRLTVLLSEFLQETVLPDMLVCAECVLFCNTLDLKQMLAGKLTSQRQSKAVVNSHGRGRQSPLLNTVSEGVSLSSQDVKKAKRRGRGRVGRLPISIRGLGIAKKENTCIDITDSDLKHKDIQCQNSSKRQKLMVANESEAGCTISLHDMSADATPEGVITVIKSEQIEGDDEQCSQPMSIQVIKTEISDSEECTSPNKSLRVSSVSDGKATAIHIVTADTDTPQVDSVVTNSPNCVTGYQHPDTLEDITGLISEINAEESCKPESKQFQCPTCPRNFNTVNGLQRHKSMHLKTTSIQCPVCPHVASSHRTIETHMKITHNKSAQLSCDYCDEDFILQTSLLQHVKNAHKGRSTKTFVKMGLAGKSSRFCPVCTESFSTNKALAHHNREKHGGQKFQCKFCHFLSNSYRTLTRHDAAVHQRENYLVAMCSICKQSFSRCEMLEEHCIKDHCLEKTFQCKLCGESFATTNMLRRHMTTHNPYSCSYCQLGFKKQETLQAHLETVHNHDKPGLMLQAVAGPDGTALMAATKDAEVRFGGELEESSPKVLSVSSEDISLQQVVQKQAVTPMRAPSGTKLKNSTASHKQAIEQKYDEEVAEKFLARFRGRDYGTKVQCIFCLKEVTIGHLRVHFKSHAGVANYHCPYCTKAAVQSTNLRKHIRTKHAEHFKSYYSKMTRKKQVECEYCKVMFDDCEALEKHLWEHLTEKKFICELCNMKFGMESNFREHRKKHYYEEHKECDGCQRKFVSIGYYEEHYEKCKSGWKCSRCLMLCNTEANYRKHWKFAHPTEDYDKYLCPYMNCGKVFFEKHRYNDHMITHDNEKKFHCPKCPKKFKRKRPLSDHLANKHDNIRCNKCCIAFLSVAELVSHRTKMHLDCMHQCGVCGLAFYTKKTLRNHMQSEHPSDDKFSIYACSECNSALVSDAELKLHYLLHLHEESSICSFFQCYQNFRDSEECLKHSQQHDVNNSCVYCQEEFNTESSLKEHFLETHGSLLMCTQCHHVFYSQDHLEAHQRQHSAEKKYCCGLCDMYSPNRSWLLNHMKFIHADLDIPLQDYIIKELVFGCTACDNHYRTEQDYQRHLQDHSSDADVSQTSVWAETKLVDGSVERGGLTSCPVCGHKWTSVEEAQRHLTESTCALAVLKQTEDNTEESVTDKDGEGMQYIVVDGADGQENIFLAVPSGEADSTKPLLMGDTVNDKRLMIRLNSDNVGQLVLYQDDGESNARIAVGSKGESGELVDDEGEEGFVLATGKMEKGLDVLLSGSVTQDKTELTNNIMSTDGLTAIITSTGELLLSQDVL